MEVTIKHWKNKKESVMRFSLSLLLIIGGVCGIVICFLSDISVSSSLYILDGLELSIVLGVFSVVVFLNGLYNLFSND